MRYGRENAEGGVVSGSPGFGELVGLLVSLRIDSECIRGGGSMKELCEVIAASGNGGMASLLDEVSIVIC